MIKPSYISHNDLYDKRLLLLILIIVQSIGIRFFDGQGLFLAVVIGMLIGPKVLLSLRLRDGYFILSTLGFLAVNYAFNAHASVERLIFQFVLILESYFFLKLYKATNLLVLHLRCGLSLISLHAVTGYAFFVLFPYLFSLVNFAGMTYLSFGSIFYLIPSGGFLPRNCGILWEPGLLQLVLNMLLFFQIKNKEASWKMILQIVTILSTFSTVGFLILGINILYYLRLYLRDWRNVFVTSIILLLFSGSIGVIVSNVTDKFGGQNTSGLIRFRDFRINMELISENPILGHSLYDSRYLMSKPYVNKIENALFSEEYLQISGELSGGQTNGLLGFFSWYGIPMGALIFALLFANRFIGIGHFERLVFFLILCFSFVSEPITYTAFFLLFPFSYYVFDKQVSSFVSK